MSRARAHPTARAALPALLPPLLSLSLLSSPLSSLSHTKLWRVCASRYMGSPFHAYKTWWRFTNVFVDKLLAEPAEERQAAYI